MVHTNLVIMGNGHDPYDLENYAFEYQIRYPEPSVSTPVAGPKSLLLLLTGGLIIVSRQFFRKGLTSIVGTHLGGILS